MRSTKAILFVFMLSWCLPSAGSYAQSVDPSLLYYPYNHLKWYTLSSEHFEVHFQEGNDRTAQIVSRIAEEVYGPITDLYRHKPNTKVSIVLKDREDYSNGAAYFFDNKIDIWVPALDSPLRGTNNWLRNVITHEFVHIVQIQASMKRSRQVPGVYVQWLGYENVRRPDVLYGYPNAVLSYPLFSINVPSWFAEGTAQFMRSDIHYDDWDAHRDMIMRTRVVAGKVLTMDQMGTFSNKIAIEREVVYNSGFAFTRYLADRFGEDVLYQISSHLGKGGVSTITHAIEKATGNNGYQVYNEWIGSLEQLYRRSLQGVRIDEHPLLESDGFVNFHARMHPDGKRIFYLSNRGRDTYRASLYTRDLESGKTELVYEPDLLGSEHVHTLSCGHSAELRLRPDASAFDLTPDGTKVLFSQVRLNRLGETYRDLHVMDIGNKKSIRRITSSARLHEPSWSPDGSQIVAIYTNDGTQNLVFVNPNSGDITEITKYNRNERIFTPRFSPDGQWVYYAFAREKGRSIRRIRLGDFNHEIILEDEYIDFRDPVLDKDGTTLYYSSDREGIFNIWRMNLLSNKEEQLTSVLGGAFMPELTHDGRIVFSEYRWDGYKIASLDLSTLPKDEAGFYKWEGYSYDREVSNMKMWNLKNHIDQSIKPFESPVWAGLDSTDFVYTDSVMRAENKELSLRRYQDVFTSISVYPAIRFDNYSKLRGSNTSLINQGRWGSLSANLWRDLKVGAYIGSRDVTEKFAVYGGALIGIGSLESDGAGDFVSPTRLVKLDRDLYLQFDYNGLPFIKRHWSPTLSLELTSIRRNVKDGLSIEEFPCISCLPDTSYANIAYDIFEAAIYFRSKLRAWDYVELGLAYSPYKVETSSFISKEYQSEIAGSSSRYFIGTRLTAAYVLRLDLPWQHSDIAPIGWKAWLRYNYEPSRLLEEYTIENGQLNPEYQNDQNHSLEWSSRYGFKFAKQTLQWNLSAFAQLKQPGDDFYLNYYGGLTGMRSYPFFALGGYRTVHSSVSWNIPMWTRIDKQLNRFTVDKVFTRIFAEAGNGWGSPLSTNESIKTGLGAELRIGLMSNYMLPSRFFVSTSYGFNDINLKLPEQFIRPTESNSVNFGREFLFHFGLLFDFEL